jgi:hypothetical protein
MIDPRCVSQACRYASTRVRCADAGAAGAMASALLKKRNAEQRQEVRLAPRDEAVNGRRPARSAKAQDASNRHQGTAGNTGPGCTALDALCGTLSGTKAELFVTKSALCNIAESVRDDLDVALIHLNERIAALRDFAAGHLSVEWKPEGGPS